VPGRLLRKTEDVEGGGDPHETKGAGKHRKKTPKKRSRVGGGKGPPRPLGSATDSRILTSLVRPLLTRWRGGEGGRWGI